MAEYRVTIKPQSPFETPFHSDTLFGHLCWALKYLEGEESLKVFLDKLKEDRSVFLLSSAFPEGYLPRPILRPMSSEEEAEVKKRFPGKKDYEIATRIKSLGRIPWIPEKLFEEVKDLLSTFHLYEKMLKEEGENVFYRTTEEWHNTINRMSGRVIEGNLFTREVTFYNGDLAIFFSDKYFGRDKLLKLFEFIGKNGYGAKASSGRGFFSCEIEEKLILGSRDPNAVMLLSHTIPSSLDPQEGHYRVFTKFCKVGGSFAVRGRFFKRPALVIEPGATFIGPPKPYYGRILNNVHSEQKEIVHYGVGLPLPVRITYWKGQG